MMPDVITILISIALPLLTGIVMPLVLVYVKKHLATAQALIDQRFENASTLVTERLNAVSQRLQKIEELLMSHDDAFERIRDRWDGFLREYLKIDSTRGTKIDAMFRVLDTTNENLRQLRSEVNQLKGLDTRLQELQIRIVTLETLLQKKEVGR